MNNVKTNVIMDSGAGCCVIDHGSLENLGLQADHIRKFNNRLLNASGHGVDILGIVNIYVKVPKFEDLILQEFKVFNSSVWPKVLVGRDLMTRSDTVKFDFKKRKSN